MSPYLTPGVYVEEVPSTTKPIEGVATSVAAFVGVAPAGPANEPVQIANWGQFERTFSDPDRAEDGPFMTGAYLAHAVYGWFQNGGGLCWVVRVGANGGDGGRPPAQATLPAAGGGDTLRAQAVDGVEHGPIYVEVSEEPRPAPSDGDGEGDGGGEGQEPPTYQVRVEQGTKREEFDGLTRKRGKTNIVTKINQSSKLIRVEDVGDGEQSLAAGRYTLETQPVAAPQITAPEFEGDVARRQGLGGLAAVENVTMVVAPDLVSLIRDGDDSLFRDQQNKLIAHCERAGNRMAILDTPRDLIPSEVHDWRMKQAGYDSKFATLYWPWIEVMDPISQERIRIPPSGHVAGVWARTDSTRGIHKAPANEVLLGVNGLPFQVTDEEQGGLNPDGINCIRAFAGRGIRIWGARTLSSDPEWRYLNVRRLFNYISESIMRGTQWAVFEPNDQGLWLQLRVAASNFLTRVWSDGALAGSTPDQGFFVRCDESTNPPEQVDAGEVVVEIGIAPVKPAEFVVFRIRQFSAGAAEVAS
jgi:phage tail sheath protein FI